MQLVPLFGRMGTLIARAWRSLTRHEPGLYALTAGVATLWVACLFYSSLRLQTLYSHLWSFPDHFETIVQNGTWGNWSAPLDDVFIHFDFARATARGFPFEWSEGNGYSSGGTSLTYPFVLAVGYRIGFRDLDLMFWAAWVASVSVFLLLLAVRRMFARLPRFTAYAAPPILLSVGALDWTLFSGMEVAFFLAVWGGAFLAWDRWLERILAGEDSAIVPGLLLGSWGAVLVATRPEGVVCVAVFAVTAALSIARRFTLRRGVLGLALAALPALTVVALHASVNYWLTGNHVAAGAVTKLELYDPYFSTPEIVEEWTHYLGYQVERVTLHHFAEGPVGWVLWPLALMPLVSPATQRYALMLWLSAVGWVLMVALNGQVRWQNERYVMPAVAWFLMNVALGTGDLLARAYRSLRARKELALGLALGEWVLVSLAVFVVAQQPRFNDQVWFFGRAARNILDQHIEVGRVIKSDVKPTPRRVLVGDAGAIAYASDLPVLDLIGLGGYRHMPFAEAHQAGLGAGLELLERIPEEERPDLLAIYPSWWGSFTDWFGHRISEVAIRGNVICGGASKVLYRPDWSPFLGSAAPVQAIGSARMVDELDLGDLVSERNHDYVPLGPYPGRVTMKILDTGPDSRTLLWDAGRIAKAGQRYSFQLRGARNGSSLRLIFRVAPVERSELSVSVNGHAAEVVTLPEARHWLEPELRIPRSQVVDVLDVTLEALGKPHALYHVWALETP